MESRTRNASHALQSHRKQSTSLEVVTSNQYLSETSHRNVRGILEQLRAELKREENRRNELEREFLQQKIIWDRERKELHEEIFELQRTERMWLDHGDQSDSRFESFSFCQKLNSGFRVSVLHKKVQELRNEKLNILKRAEMDRMSWEQQKEQLIMQLRQVSFDKQTSELNPFGKVGRPNTTAIGPAAWHSDWVERSARLGPSTDWNSFTSALLCATGSDHLS